MRFNSVRSNLMSVAVMAALAAMHPAHAQDAAQSAPAASELDALRAQIAALQAQVDSLQERTDAQSDINIASAKAAEDAQATSDKVAGLAKLVNDTKISGRLYYDFTNVDDSSKGAKTDKSGSAFDIKRFYLGVDHKFDDKWAINLTTDFQYSSAVGATELYIKKAYVQYTVSDAFVLRAGSTDLPWV
ncbi:MAG TPA: porin, partial [Luteimonas sp.]|nr:porin [Luteimonas sp.]